jgi:hypothetical protein
MDLGVTYISAHQPQHIAPDMQHLQEIGCSEVLFALQENHIDVLTGALRFGARIALDHGLRPYVVVWGFANTFGGGRMSLRMLDDRSLWRVERDGTPMPKACLNNPRLVDRFADITELCCRHGYQGMFVDEPTIQECFCPICRDTFRAAYGADLVASYGSPAYRAFQSATVSHYTRAVSARVKAIDARLRTMTCIMPIDQDSFEAVAAIPELDVFGTDPYWLLPGAAMTIEQAVACAEQARDAGRRHGKVSQVWLNCWGIPAGSEAAIYTGGRALAAIGCDSMYTWSFRGGLGTNEECTNAALAWDSVVRLYQELSGK